METLELQNKSNGFVRFLKSFTLYQWIYLSVVVALTLGFVIFMPENMLDDTSNTFTVICSVVAALANPLCSLLISKQSKWNFIVDLVLIELTEMAIYFYLGNYTSAIVAVAFWVPVDIASFIRWHKHPDTEDDELTVVKRLTWKQDIFVIAAILAFGFGLGSVMKLIPGAADTYLDAFAAAFGITDGVLLLLRYHEQWYAWMVAVILYIIIYIKQAAFIMLIPEGAMLVNTCYGFVKWYIYTRKNQSKNQSKDPSLLS